MTNKITDFLFRNELSDSDLKESKDHNKQSLRFGSIVREEKCGFPPDNILPLSQNGSSMNQVDFLTIIVNSFPGNKLILDRKGIIIWHQPSNEENIVHHFHEGVVGGHISGIYPEYILDGVSSNIENAFSTNEQQLFEYPLKGIDGKDYFFLLNVNPISKEQVFLSIQNVTKKKLAEEELLEQSKKLEQNNKQLKKTQASNEQLENFAYIASHDLREPLRTINNFSDLLNRNYREQLDEDGQTYLDFIVHRSKQMSYLIDDLLTYSRVNTENYDIEEVDFDELIDDIELSLMQVIKESKVIIKRENDLPGGFYGNPVKMKQLFQNLIANAIKFRKKGVPCEVIIRASEKHDTWNFDVEDNGIGIQKEFQRQIFVLFKKLHATSSYPGTGLGLAICKKVIEQHNGNIWVNSEPDKGSNFSFTIKKNLEKN